MINQSPILITGTARSGSSMIAATINLCGAFGGNMSVGTQSFKRGMFENANIRDTVVKSYLVSIGKDPMGQYPLPETKDIVIPNQWKERIEKILFEEGCDLYSKGSWMYKDSRSCLLWPIWHFAYPDAKWIIVRRRTGDIVESCLKTGFMAAFKSYKTRCAVAIEEEREGWLWWVHEYEKKFVEMITEGLNCKIIWPERMVNGDYRQLYELCEWLHLPWKTEALDFIDPLLWKSRQKKGGNVWHE